MISPRPTPSTRPRPSHRHDRSKGPISEAFQLTPPSYPTCSQYNWRLPTCHTSTLHNVSHNHNGSSISSGLSRRCCSTLISEASAKFIRYHNPYIYRKNLMNSPVSEKFHVTARFPCKGGCPSISNQPAKQVMPSMLLFSALSIGVRVVSLLPLSSRPEQRKSIHAAKILL